jgi:hypothetical protein
MVERFHGRGEFVPGRAHDDQVDALSQALAYLRGTGWSAEDSKVLQETARMMAGSSRHWGAGRFEPQYPGQMNSGSCLADDAYEDSLQGGPRLTIGSRWSRFHGTW